MLASLLGLAVALCLGTGEPVALEGRLVDPEGRPIPGVVLVPRREGRSQWRTSSRVTTDGSGAFRFAGLAPGAYRIGFDRPRGSEAARAFESGPLHTSAGPALVVAPVAHIHAEVGRDRAFCVRTGPRLAPAHEPLQVGFLWTQPYGSHWLVDDGATYVCGRWSPQRGLVEREVALPVGREFANEVDLSLPELAPLPARIELDVHDPGRPEPMLRVLAPRSRQELVVRPATWRAAGRAGWCVDLPPGRYVARIDQRVSDGLCMCSEQAPPTRAELEFALELAPGEVLVRSLDWPPGAPCTLQVEAPGAPFVQVERLDRATDAVRLMDFLPARLGCLEPHPERLVPGQARRSLHPLAVGVHRLRISAEGFEGLDVELAVREGVDALLHVALEPVR